jgi:catechol 2,3-dioxygenase-like lactoylglutathione lyase family enzyme
VALKLTALTPLISVFDMPGALAFYRDRLGFQIVAHSPEIEAPEGRFFHWVWLKLGAADLMLNTAYDAGERPPVRDPARVAAHVDTGLFFSCPDVDEAYATLKAAGLDLAPPRVAPYGMKQLWLTDPDGYQLCFQQEA